MRRSQLELIRNMLTCLVGPPLSAVPTYLTGSAIDLLGPEPPWTYEVSHALTAFAFIAGWIVVTTWLTYRLVVWLTRDWERHDDDHWHP